MIEPGGDRAVVLKELAGDTSKFLSVIRERGGDRDGLDLLSERYVSELCQVRLSNQTRKT